MYSIRDMSKNQIIGKGGHILADLGGKYTTVNTILYIFEMLAHENIGVGI